MPRIEDRAAIRDILETDRIWGAYALADLEPDQWEHCDWLVSSDGTPATVLVYRAFSSPVLVVVGEAWQLAEILDEVDQAIRGAETVYLVARPDVYALFQTRYSVIESKRMLRMHYQTSPELPQGPPVDRLHAADLDALQRLYADGDESGESPDFFTPEMLRRGVYFGAGDNHGLAAVAGTHVVAPTVGVGAIGNVYTRRDCRGRGLGRAVTFAVTSTLRESGLSTIVLNVWTENPGAIRLYKQLGFVPYCEFYEAYAARRRD